MPDTQEPKPAPVILALVNANDKSETQGFVVKVGESYVALDEEGNEYLSNRPEVFADLGTANGIAVLFE